MKLPPAVHAQVLAAAGNPEPGRPQKYGNRKVVTPEGKFDSRSEYRRWLHLKTLCASGGISYLRKQVPYRLVVNGVLVARYVADFVYLQDGQLVVEDVKGFRTPMYKLKKKLMAACHNIKIQEV